MVKFAEPLTSSSLCLELPLLPTELHKLQPDFIKQGKRSMVLSVRRLTALINFMRDESKLLLSSPFPSLPPPPASPTTVTTEATSANKWQRHLAADGVCVRACARARARFGPALHLAHLVHIAQKQKFQLLSHEHTTYLK